MIAQDAARSDLSFLKLGTRYERITEACDDPDQPDDNAGGGRADRGAALRIDNDGQPMHIAGCVGTTAAVVFVPTSSYFG